MMIVWFSRSNGQPVAVNSDRVCYVHTSVTKPSETYINFGNDHGIVVEMEADRVVEMLR